MNIQLGNLSDMIMAIAAIINLLFVRHVYYRDIDRRLKEEEERRENKKASIASRWYRDMILERNLAAIHEFFDSSIRAINNLEIEFSKSSSSQNLHKKLFGEYTDKKMSLSHSISDLIRILDKQMGQKIDDYLESFQDSFTEYMANILDGNSTHDFESGRRMVYEQRKILLEVLYKYEYKFLNLKDSY